MLRQNSALRVIGLVRYNLPFRHVVDCISVQLRRTVRINLEKGVANSLKTGSPDFAALLRRDVPSLRDP
jgi:hypothetical protein